VHVFAEAEDDIAFLTRLQAIYRVVGQLNSQLCHHRVGMLSEMPPEGKVGISPVCLLGVNINAGQEISLRLRTDDLKVVCGMLQGW
jgi:WLM domain